MIATSTITLDESAVRNNWKFLREYFGDVKISAVVKGNAYGHGIDAYVPLAEACGVTHFSVFNAHEAYEVCKVASPQTDIMIMGAMDEKDIVWAIENGIEFYVFDFDRLHTTINIAEQKGLKAKIHIEFETGMFRTGFDSSEINLLIDTLRDHEDKLLLRGLCMHFAGAESISNYLRLKRQKAEFKKAVGTFEAAGLKADLVHTCCSAAAVRFPDMHYDMLRIGIMQYGFWPNLEVFVEYALKHDTNISPLKRVISWDTYVMSLKNVPAGTFVGYGQSFYSHSSMQIAIAPVGYAHGFSRSLSNTGVALVNGWRCPVVGIVNMNCVALDVTMAPDVKTGDKVTMIGHQDDQEMTVASFGEMSNQLNYELLTRLPLDIPRKVNRVYAPD